MKTFDECELLMKKKNHITAGRSSHIIEKSQCNWVFRLQW